MDNYKTTVLAQEVKEAVQPFRFTVPSMNIGDQKRLISQMVSDQNNTYKLVSEPDADKMEFAPLIIEDMKPHTGSFSSDEYCDNSSTYSFQWFDADYCVITKVVRRKLSNGSIFFANTVRYGTNLNSIVYNFNELLQLEPTVETTEREVTYLKTFNKVTWQ